VTVTLIVTAAVLTDWWLGEPRRLHPLIGFGHLATWVECRFYGSPAVYCGQREERPLLGEGTPPEPEDIGRALSLVRRGVGLWLAVIGIGDHLLG
jgi:cobalamin biosynthesis protein CobD/CbiB